MMKPYEQYLEIVNNAIAALPYPDKPERLYQPINYTMAGGGKRLRPVLTLMACDALGGNLQQALPPAVGLEMFHNFTLLHDDVMDHAELRRGKPTVHCRWNDNVAILSGDAMLIMAADLIARTPQPHTAEAIALFHRTALQICEGQQWDMDFEQRDDVTLDEYMEMIRFKTSVLLGCAMQMGALVAGDAERGRWLYEAGVNVGLAFQLQDDALDVWGDPAVFGKQNGGDILNNKKTFLLISALQLSTGSDADELRRWLNDPAPEPDQKIAAVTALYDRLGLRRRSDEAIAKYNDRARQALSQAKLDPEGERVFSRLMDDLAGRRQ